MNEDQNEALEELVKDLMKIQTMVHEDIVSNDSFDVEDLELIRNHLDDMIQNISFHKQNNNLGRVVYELKNHIHWIMNNYS
jgi:hypothetical protein